MNIDGVEFTEKPHLYTFHGEPILSVTQILKMVGAIDTTWFTEWAADRGSIVHKATELDDLGELDEDSIDDRISGYVEAWRKWKRENKWDLVDMEQMVLDESLGYAGTLDRAGWLNARQFCILDLKTGNPHRAVGLQLTGYAYAYQALKNQYVHKLLGVYLRQDGTYRQKAYPADFATWRAAVAMARWIEEG